MQTAFVHRCHVHWWVFNITSQIINSPNPTYFDENTVTGRDLWFGGSPPGKQGAGMEDSHPSCFTHTHKSPGLQACVTHTAIYTHSIKLIYDPFATLPSPPPSNWLCRSHPSINLNLKKTNAPTIIVTILLYYFTLRDYSTQQAGQHYFNFVWQFPFEITWPSTNGNQRINLLKCDSQRERVMLLVVLVYL